MSKAVKHILRVAVFCLCSFGSLTAQDSARVGFQIIELKDYFDHLGAIVNREYESKASTFYKKERFTPNIEQVNDAEKVMQHLVSMVMGSYADGRKGALKKLRKYYRHYIGYINNSGEKVIVLWMVDPKAFEKNKLLDEWKTRLISMSGSFDDKYLRIYSINLQTRELEETSDSLSEFVCRE